MWAKLVAKAIVATRSIIRVKPKANTLRSTHKEQFLSRYPFMPEIKGMEPLERFNPLKFAMYDGKSDYRSHISHF